MSIGPISSVSTFAAPPAQKAESTEAPGVSDGDGDTDGSSASAPAVTSASPGASSGSGQVDVKA
jgi:hypothetical protein